MTEKPQANPELIIKGLAVGSFGSNCYILGSATTKEGMIVDPGFDAEVILKYVADLGLTIKYIVATHTHPDHIMALAEVKRQTGATYALHQDEPPGTARRGGMMGMSSEPPPPPDMLLKEGDVLELGGLKFTVRHTPGHSPGGLTLVGEGLAITGDALFQFSIGRTDFGAGSQAQLVQGIQEKIMCLPDETIVLPGHGPTTRVGIERQWNPFLQRPGR